MENMKNGNQLNELLYFMILGVGYYLSSCVNPLLYSVMSKRFRRGFVDMFRRNNSSAQNLNLMAAKPILVNGGCIGSNGHHNNRLREVRRVGNRELARYELQIAPKHVIPPHHKKDILKRAFKFREDYSSKKMCF